MIEKSEILPLTGLRFFAALYVFIFHIHIRWPLTENPYVKNILDQGAIGMSLFFILSGFVLAYRYSSGGTAYRSYLVSRFSRIYPVYLLAAVATIPWMGVNFGDGSFVDTALAVSKVAMLVVANLFVIQAWFPQMFNYWNDGASWSISVEVFCYFLLPLMLPALNKMKSTRLLLLGAGCAVFSALIGVSAALFDDAANKVFYSIPIFRLPEFVVGICACLCFMRGHGRRAGQSMQVVVLGLLVLYLSVVGSKMPLYVGHNWIVIPTIAFLLVSLSAGGGILNWLLSTRLVVWLGKISYSFYSLQFLVIIPLVEHHADVVGEFSALNNPKILMVCAFLVLVAASAVAHHFVEEPMRKWINRKYQEKQRGSRHDDQLLAVAK
ncbi:acyltransferase family protein [Pseudomonas sp. UFMG81]|uniref:acyltransferase family protein n=1 Tax=Pseudomonas sp. UFMG81 TaxID=2745936 RepID=UPI00188F0502|nr:acyltransferase [Pseudomonas sp. UFMG81]